MLYFNVEGAEAASGNLSSATAQSPSENCGGLAHARELDIGRAHITPLLKVLREQPANQRARYHPMDVAKSRCPNGVQRATATQFTFLDSSSARTLR